MNSGDSKIIPFSKHSSIDGIKKRQLKIPGAETSSARKMRSGKPQPPLIALFEERPIRESLLKVLRNLDAEQQQIMEIIGTAIARGAL